MTSYLIEVQKDTLQVGFNSEINATGERIVKDTSETIEYLISSEQLPKTKILKINGRSSVLVSYVLAHEFSHLYSAIAVSDPRLKDCFVITVSYDRNYKVGDIINRDNCLVTIDHDTDQDVCSVTFKLEDDTLKVGFNPEITTTGDRIVRDMAKQIEKAIATEQIQGGKLLKIDGRISVLASYVIAHKLAHFYSAIAVFDPKLSELNQKCYVVTVQHGSKYQVGDVLTQAKTGIKT